MRWCTQARGNRMKHTYECDFFLFVYQETSPIIYVNPIGKKKTRATSDKCNCLIICLDFVLRRKNPAVHTGRMETARRARKGSAERSTGTEPGWSHEKTWRKHPGKASGTHRNWQVFLSLNLVQFTYTFKCYLIYFL